MAKINDGGQAFPVPEVPTVWSDDGRPCGGHDQQPGMSLRDYFAAAAMQTSAFQQFAVALVKAIKPDDQRVTLGIHPETTAREAYRIADAMIAARGAQ